MHFLNAAALPSDVKSALILVDLENEWRNPSSEYYVGNLKGLIANTNKLIDFCRKKGSKIIFIRHVEKSGKAFRKGTRNTALFEELHRDRKDSVITKHKISPFYKTGFESKLKGVKGITVAGILTNLCVRSTVNDAYDRDFPVTLVEDCCVSVSRKMHNHTLEDIRLTRPEVKIVKLNKFIGGKK